MEDEDQGTDSLGKGEHILPTNGQGTATARNFSYSNLDPSHTELKTLNMLESCASALGEIKNVLTTHANHQETLIQVAQGLFFHRYSGSLSTQDMSYCMQFFVPVFFEQLLV